MTALLFGVDGFAGPGAAVVAAAAALVRHAVRRGVQHQRARGPPGRDVLRRLAHTPGQHDHAAVLGTVLGAGRIDVAAGWAPTSPPGVRSTAWGAISLLSGAGRLGPRSYPRAATCISSGSRERLRTPTAACNGRLEYFARTLGERRADRSRLLHGSPWCRSRGGSTPARASSWSARRPVPACRAATATRRR